MEYFHILCNNGFSKNKFESKTSEALFVTFIEYAGYVCAIEIVGPRPDAPVGN